ncbi:hypothetical protein JX266_012943 [Neoarthrinium moseri]|uniref:uncharacterized protein n=1 Tax=Neoarthrinium moseri TaxID=1658444 RepID=UPI001FDC7D41|nr:uncharacterized protein JN550_013497 [Neoarthrinium moseri]KAI1840861.1 hypothetical protein JX266_012943 [Neoarthrinium moseri]KAI1857004.1 hypothetical protein JN550_013497 [Neoarthrinium moseri]
MESYVVQLERHTASGYCYFMPEGHALYGMRLRHQADGPEDRLPALHNENAGIDSDVDTDYDFELGSVPTYHIDNPSDEEENYGNACNLIGARVRELIVREVHDEEIMQSLFEVLANALACMPSVW